MMGKMTVDPLERAMQKMAGRTQGGATDGIKLKKKPTIMTSYGMSVMAEVTKTRTAAGQAI